MNPAQRMRTRSLVALAWLCAALPASGATDAVECHAVKSDGAFHNLRALKGQKPAGVFFTGMLQVDVDGAPDAYHPGFQCKKGQQCTLSAGGTDCKGACIGNPDSCKGIDGLGSARSGNNPTGALVKQGAGGTSGAPCLQPNGFYIAASSLRVPANNRSADKRFHVCSTWRYVDANRIQYFAFSNSPTAKKLGVHTGDLAAVAHWGQTAADDKVVFAVLGDTGEKGEGHPFGEGSRALAHALGAWENPSPGHNKACGKSPKEFPGDPKVNEQVAWLIFPGSAHLLKLPSSSAKEAEWTAHWPLQQASIDAAGRKLLDDWGGREQFKRLTKSLPRDKPHASAAKAKPACP